MLSNLIPRFVRSVRLGARRPLSIVPARTAAKRCIASGGRARRGMTSRRPAPTIMPISFFFSGPKGVTGDNFSEVTDSDKPAVEKSDSQWMEQLGADAFRILRQHGTEAPDSHPFNYNKESGVYACAGCGAELFTSSQKYNSMSGWPSFKDNVPGSIVSRTDVSMGMVRTEILCANCHGHLGHVFNDGPAPTRLRHCVNGLALDFKPSSETSDS